MPDEENPAFCSKCDFRFVGALQGPCPECGAAERTLHVSISAMVESLPSVEAEHTRLAGCGKKGFLSEFLTWRCDFSDRRILKES